MSNLFNIDIAALVNQHIANLLLDAVLIKIIHGERDLDNITAGMPFIVKEFEAKGLVDDYENDIVDGTLILEGDKRVLLIANSIVDNQIPVVGDHLLIENATYKIISVSKDPASATYTCQCRD